MIGTTSQPAAPAQPQAQAQNTDVYGRPDIDSFNFDDFSQEDDQTKEESQLPPEAIERTQQQGDNFDDLVKEERKKFLEKRELAKKKHQEDQESRKAKEQSDYIDKFLEEMAGESKQELEKSTENKTYTAKEVEDLIKQKIEETFNQNREKETEQRVVTDFKNKISETLKASGDKYGLIEATGNSDLVYDLISEDYANNAEQYGDAWARQNIMSIEEASAQVQKNLATQLDGMLKSDHIKNYVLNYYKIAGQTSRSEQTPKTLSSDFTSVTSTPKNDSELSDDERFEEALKLI